MHRLKLLPYTRKLGLSRNLRASLQRFHESVRGFALIRDNAPLGRLRPAPLQGPSAMLHPRKRCRPDTPRPLSTFPLEDFTHIRIRTQEWLKMPTGDMSPEEWYNIHHDITKLLQFEGRRFDSIELCFNLLDRLAAEQNILPSITRADWVNSALITQIIQEWYHLFSDGPVPPHKFLDKYGPASMVNVMNHYCLVFKEVKWSKEVAYYILAAFNAHLKNISRSDEKALNTDRISFATRVLDIAMNEWKRGNENCKPGRALIQAVANTCTSRDIPQEQRRKAAIQVDSLLVLVGQELGRPLDARLFSSAINAWAMTRSEEGALKAHERLDQMWEVREDQEETVPGWVWVNALRSTFQAWAWSRHPDTLRRVDVLLAVTLNFTETGLVPPNVKLTPVWNAALQALAMVGTPEAAAKATEIVQVFDHGNETPDRHTFYWYIASLVNGDEVEQGGTFLLDSVKSGVIDGQEDFLSMVLQGWARSNHEDKYGRALHFLEEMARLSDGQIVPSTMSYNSLLECCSTSKGDPRYLADEGLRIIGEMRKLQLTNKDSPVAPDRKSYTSVIKCLARTGNFTRAVHLYEEVLKIFQKEGDYRLQPDTVMFNAVLSAFNRSTRKSALQGALAFFQKSMARHKAGTLPEGPDVYSFTTLVSCIARSMGGGQTGKEKAKIASSLLNQLQTLYTKEEHSKWQPNTAMYNAVMNCWAKAGCPDDCEDTLNRMLLDYESGNTKAIPDIQSFNILLDALASSKSETAPARADDLFSKIKDLHWRGVLRARPNDVTYTSLIRCHLNNGGDEGLKRAEELLQEVLSEYKQGTFRDSLQRELRSLIDRVKSERLLPMKLSTQSTSDTDDSATPKQDSDTEENVVNVDAQESTGDAQEGIVTEEEGVSPSEETLIPSDAQEEEEEEKEEEQQQDPQMQKGVIGELDEDEEANLPDLEAILNSDTKSMSLTTNTLYTDGENIHIPWMHVFRYSYENEVDEIEDFIGIDMGIDGMVNPLVSVIRDGRVLEVVSNVPNGYLANKSLYQRRQAAAIASMSSGQDVDAAKYQYNVLEARRVASIRGIRAMKKGKGDTWCEQYTRVPLPSRVEEKPVLVEIFTDEHGRKSLTIDLKVADEDDTMEETEH